MLDAVLALACLQAIDNSFGYGLDDLSSPAPAEDANNAYRPPRGSGSEAPSRSSFSAGQNQQQRRESSARAVSPPQQQQRRSSSTAAGGAGGADKRRASASKSPPAPRGSGSSTPAQRPSNSRGSDREGTPFDDIPSLDDYPPPTPDHDKAPASRPKLTPAAVASSPTAQPAAQRSAAASPAGGKGKRPPTAEEDYEEDYDDEDFD